ncbi:MAG TPA: VOC family protein [Ramlibacter sp.]|nr:VOC family protein [Ramlibacter sp.]
MQIVSKIVPCLWFDRQAEEAARFYTGVFPGGRIHLVTRYPNVGQEIHGGKAGSVLTVEFELAGQRFTALNGGPVFTFNEALSLQVMCESQEEIDHFWDRLGEGGDPRAQQCGWLKDRFGVSWQVVPQEMLQYLVDPDPAKVERSFSAMLEMKKLDIAALRRAHAGR